MDTCGPSGKGSYHNCCHDDFQSSYNPGVPPGAACAGPANWICLPPRLFTAAVCGAVTGLKQTLCGQANETYALDQCGTVIHGKSCCGIPETHCPDRCVCLIHWSGCAGDTLHYRVQISNLSKLERDFTLHALPFPCTEEVVQVVPDQKTLAPGDSFQAEISFTIPETFAGSLYHTDILLTGAYEQSIRIHLYVKPRQACCCHIGQGDIPKRIKAHHWFHHFQCEQACFSPPDKP